MQLNLSPATRTLFEQWGWSLNRRASDEDMQEWLVLRLKPKPRPLIIHPLAYEVLRTLGGLSIGIEDDFYFPIVWHPNSFVVAKIGWWSGHEWNLRDSLFPVGFFGSRGNEEVIALGQSGKVYGIDDIAPGELLLGDTIEEAIERIVQGDIFKRVNTHTDHAVIEVVRAINKRLSEI